ncbi:hypothetical protein [Nonomuraea sp. NPDC050783]|uniref:hypothetical protein n=1 Tax=Nonomuraea sp. NPDC050783 TaxID=3154634 RepID=UPI00346700BE
MRLRLRLDRHSYRWAPDQPAASAVQHLSVVSSWYTFMIEQGACRANPAGQVRNLLGRDRSEGPLTLWTGEQPPRPHPFQELGADLSAALRAYLTLRVERVGRPVVLLSGPLLAVPVSRQSPRDRVMSCARIGQMVRTALERGGIALPERVRVILTPTASPECCVGSDRGALP